MFWADCYKLENDFNFFSSVFRILEEGDLVTSLAGDAVIEDIVCTAEGFREYFVRLVDSGVVRKFYRHNLFHIETFTEEDDAYFNDIKDYMLPVDDIELYDPDLASVTEAKRKRFAQVESAIDLELLADERQSRMTNYQTTWAVKVFKGNFITQFCVLYMIQEWG